LLAASPCSQVFIDRYRGQGEAGITPTAFALVWCYHLEHACSAIFGATTIPQLEENLKSYDIKLDDDVIDKITNAHKKYTDPTKGYFKEQLLVIRF
jgi:aryl-alcohol dehydrogenase-like predicted oxidoreductase